MLAQTATGGIQGTVADASSNKPIAGAFVIAIRSGLPPFSQTAQSGADGSYQLQSLPATNHGGYPYGSTNFDANGNQLYGPLDPASGNWMGYGYDVENRITSAGSNGGSSTGYGYDPQGKRVLVQTSGPGMPPGNGAITSYLFTFYGITGQRVSTFGVTTSQYYNSGVCNAARYCSGGGSPWWLYFGGRLIAVNGFAATTDRLGSVRSGISYYPWGEEKTSPPTQDGQVKLATYFRDMPGQDYADQRYYTSNAGRFYTPDPNGAVDLGDPITWNKYVYANDDPVNFHDPHGTLPCLGDGGGGIDDGFGRLLCRRWLRVVVQSRRSDLFWRSR